MIDIQKIVHQHTTYRIVCVGDSTTSAEWVHPNWIDYVEFALREGLQLGNGRIFKMINSACDGADLSGINRCIEEDVLFFKPHLVTLMIGLNDMISEIPPDAFQKGLHEFIEKTRDNTEAEIALLTPTVPKHKEIAEKLENYAAVIRQVSQTKETYLVDIFEAFSEIDLAKVYTYRNDDGNSVWGIEPGEIDYLHPNVLGNRIIAETILNDLFQIGIPDWGEFGNISEAQKE